MTDDLYALLDSHDGVGLAELVAKRQISPLELAEVVIARIEAVNPKLNAIAEKCYEAGRAAAAQPRSPGGLFTGVPTLIKDLYSPVQEALMTNGSLAAPATRMDMDCAMVARLKQAGCIVLGTTTSPEFGTSYTTESSRFGITRNPWDLGVTSK